MFFVLCSGCHRYCGCATPRRKGATRPSTELNAEPHTIFCFCHPRDYISHVHASGACNMALYVCGTKQWVGLLVYSRVGEHKHTSTTVFTSIVGRSAQGVDTNRVNIARMSSLMGVFVSLDIVYALGNAHIYAVAVFELPLFCCVQKIRTLENRNGYMCRSCSEGTIKYYGGGAAACSLNTKNLIILLLFLCRHPFPSRFWPFAAGSSSWLGLLFITTRVRKLFVAIDCLMEVTTYISLPFFSTSDFINFLLLLMELQSTVLTLTYSPTGVSSLLGQFCSSISLCIC